MPRRRQSRTGWLLALAATVTGGWLGLTAPTSSPVAPSVVGCSSGCSGSAHS